MRRTSALALIATAASSAVLLAHEGPPFPIVSDRAAGPYIVSIWTDPDATDDGSLGGQFWVVLNPAAKGSTLPAATRAVVALRPLDREGPAQTAPAAPVRGDVSNQFAAVLMDHEGRFAVTVTINGPLGHAVVDNEVDATYNLRPPAFMVAVYALPFLLAGLLWTRLLLRRRVSRR